MNFSFWVKLELFSYGVFFIVFYFRLVYNNVKKIVIYVKNKGLFGFLKFNYLVWRYIVCNKLYLLEDLVWMYFLICYFLSEDLLVIERVEWD